MLQQAASLGGFFPFFFVFLKARWDLRLAENTEPLCHDTMIYDSSPQFPRALQPVKEGEGEYFFLSQQPCAFIKAPITQLAFPSRDSAEALQTAHSDWMEKSHSSLLH